MRRVDWRFWTAAGLLALAYLLLGYVYGKTAPDNLLYDIAGVGTFCAAVLFIAVYTVLGLRGPAKWWRNDTGSSLVIAVGGIACITGPIAFAVLFNHGMINTQWWAWAEIGGTYMCGLAVLWLSFLWLRDRNGGGKAV
jgi:hypothetical protein